MNGPCGIAEFAAHRHTDRMTANMDERDNREDARDYPEGPGDIPADTWALRLVASRHHAGRLSINKAAARCGLDPDKWARWEAGGQPRDDDKVEVTEAIAEGLGMNLTWLLFGGKLLPARGRPVRKASNITGTYRGLPERVAVCHPTGRPRKRTSSTTQSVRPHRVIDRSQPVAV